MSERNRTGEYESQGRASLGLGKDRAVLDRLVRYSKAKSQSEVVRAALRLAWRYRVGLFDTAMQEVRDAR